MRLSISQFISLVQANASLQGLDGLPGNFVQNLFSVNFWCFNQRFENGSLENGQEYTVTHLNVFFPGVFIIQLHQLKLAHLKTLHVKH